MWKRQLELSLRPTRTGHLGLFQRVRQSFTELNRTPIYVEFHTAGAYMTNTLETLFRK